MLIVCVCFLYFSSSHGLYNILSSFICSKNSVLFCFCVSDMANFVGKNYTPYSLLELFSEEADYSETI